MPVMLRIGVVVVLFVGACAEQSQSVDLPPPVEAGCLFDQATIDAAGSALMSERPPEDDIEPLAVLASGLSGKKWHAVVLRWYDNAILAVGYVDSDIPDAAIALAVAPGDIITADLVWRNTMLETVHLQRKGAFAVSRACPQREEA